MLLFLIDIELHRLGQIHNRAIEPYALIAATPGFFQKQFVLAFLVTDHGRHDHDFRGFR